MTHDEILDYVRRKASHGVPLIGHMQLDVVSWSPGQVIVEAPLVPNLNTHGTAFGGSLYCVASVAGWAMVHLTLMEAGLMPSVWIVKGEINYSRPVNGVLRATASLAEDARLALVEQFKARGKAKASVDIRMQENGQECVALTAMYAAVTQET